MSGPFPGRNNRPADNSPTLASIEEIARQVPGGFLIYRAEMPEEILFANDVLLDIFGCATQEEFRQLTGGTFRGIVHPDDLDRVESSVENQILHDARQLDYVEYRIRRRDGEIRWVDDYGRLVLTEDYGNVFYVFIRDITALHLSREENARRAEVIEGLSIDFSSIYLLNLDTGSMRPYRLQNTYFNELVKDFAGPGGPEKDQAESGSPEKNQTESGIPEKNPAESVSLEADWRKILPAYAQRYIVPEDRERFLYEINAERIREHLTYQRSYSISYRIRGTSDEILYMQMSVVQIAHGADRRHVVMGIRDVTEQTLHVQREMSERLKTEIDLEREKHANEIKSSFLFNISHDIRTPMNAIMGFTNLARRHINNPGLLSDYLGKVDESSRHLLSLIDDLLEMSRLDYGRIELKAEPCILREQIDMTLDMFRPGIEEKHLILKENLDALPEGTVLVDASRFRRVMENLIGNAVKFTPPNGMITVSAYQKQVSESGYARYEFSVADTGIGMSEEFIKRMYKAFEREESSTRSGSTGTGLGLAIAKNLLDIMGGSISVRSQKGKGSVFTVDLPLKLAGHTPAESTETNDAPTHKAEGTYRILLVEDIEINRMLAETILEEADFLVESVPDGCDAVDAIRDHAPWYYDLVLMDIQMPVMNGYEATRAIRAIGRDDTDEIPIIALSANARDEDKRMSMESGMNNHIAKPFDIAHLISAINEHISMRQKDAF